MSVGVALEDCERGIERKESTNYQGRTQNWVMAAVSPRKLQNVVCLRLDWLGVVWWNVASWYTSKTDHRVAIVSTEQRLQGYKVCTALHDGLLLDADGMLLRDSILARAGVTKTVVKTKRTFAKWKLARIRPLGETAPGLVPSFSF